MKVEKKHEFEKKDTKPYTTIHIFYIYFFCNLTDRRTKFTDSLSKKKSDI